MEREDGSRFVGNRHALDSVLGPVAAVLADVAQIHARIESAVVRLGFGRDSVRDAQLPTRLIEDRRVFLRRAEDDLVDRLERIIVLTAESDLFEVLEQSRIRRLVLRDVLDLSF